MKDYLGEFPIDVKDTRFKDFTKENWVMYFVERFGQIDGDHHKAWVLDRVARILYDTPIEIVEARWGKEGSYTLKELRVRVGQPSEKYLEWVKEMKGEFSEENKEYEYSYNVGIAP